MATVHLVHGVCLGQTLSQPLRILPGAFALADISKAGATASETVDLFQQLFVMDSTLSLNAFNQERFQSPVVPLYHPCSTEAKNVESSSTDAIVTLSIMLAVASLKHLVAFLLTALSFLSPSVNAYLTK